MGYLRVARYLKMMRKEYRPDNIFIDKNGGLFSYIKEIKEDKDLIFVRLKGAIDAETIPLIEKNCRDRMINCFERNVLVDFREVTHVDSSTVAGILLLLEQLRQHHRKFGIINMNDTLKSYVNIEHPRPTIQEYPTEEEALEDLADIKFGKIRNTEYEIRNMK